MGAFLSHLAGKLLGDSSKQPSMEVGHSEVDHNAIVCCGTMNLTEVEQHEDSSQDEKETHR
jgi:hypothetical protein